MKTENSKRRAAPSSDGTSGRTTPAKPSPTALSVVEVTHGPWEVGELDRGLGRSSFCVLDKDGNIIAKLGPEPAHAQLIAAAPELYAALEVLVAIYGRDHEFECSVNVDGEGCNCRLAAARAALAKARGETE
jgi:hypothetical protein